MPGQLVRRFEVDDPDHGSAFLDPMQDIHGIQIHVEDVQPVNLGQCLRHLYRGSDIGDHFGGHRLCPDCRRERELVEQGSDQIDTTPWQASMRLDDGKIRRIGQIANHQWELFNVSINPNR